MQLKKVGGLNLKSFIFKIVLFFSLLLNLVLICKIIHQALDGCAEIANGRIGVLTKDVEVGLFQGEGVIFKLPKGLVVREASATGAGWFEPYRFRIVVTSDEESIVDYSQSGQVPEGQNSEYYSVKIRRD